MRARDDFLRAKRFEADEKARKAADLERMIGEFAAMAADLDRQIAAEEDRTGVRDLRHVSYSTFAKSAAQRRDNLRASVEEFKARFAVAARERDEAFGDLARLEMRKERRAASGAADFKSLPTLVSR